MLPTILAVFAHPDDESFCCGGTLARLAQVARVEVLCLTHGEASAIKPPQGQSVAQLRQAELEAACQILGAAPPHFLGYQDGGFRTPSQLPKRLVDADVFVVAREVHALIAELEPQLLLTFDPRGYYGHPDHIATHRIASAAFFSSGGLPNPPRQMLYPMPSPAMLERFNTAGFGFLGEEYALPDPFLTVDCSSVLEHKRAALLAHHSQSQLGTGIDKLLPELHANTSSVVLTEERFALGGWRGQVNLFAQLQTNTADRLLGEHLVHKLLL
jgi:N-acetyl-1-D-myo-inositol-2-amino-2-deoxy-alpha-D-glucopyranoside deacetylase